MAKDARVQIRTDSELWREYRQRLADVGSDASSELREFMLWQLGRAGARRPRRLDES